VTSSFAVFKAAIRVKSGLKIKKENYENKRYFYINLYLTDRIDIEFMAC